MVKKIVSKIIRTFQFNKKIYSYNYELNGYKRVYNFHIRKTGGTSLNNSFLEISGGNSGELYNNLAISLAYRIEKNSKVFVGWNKSLIEGGNYFFAFSHIPYHKIKLPPETFTITCFRDPLVRVISHYKMLLYYKQNKINHPCMNLESRWLGKSFSDFILRIPSEHLLGQLYMFSEIFDISEALNRLKKINCIMFTENFSAGIETINNLTGLKLESRHQRKSELNLALPEGDLSLLREKLEKEYELLRIIKNEESFLAN